MSSTSAADIKRRRTSAWSIDDVKKLCEVIRSCGEGKWKMCSKRFPDKTPQQCRDRWNNKLKDGLTKGSWTDEEDHIIINRGRGKRILYKYLYIYIFPIFNLI